MEPILPSTLDPHTPAVDNLLDENADENAPEEGPSGDTRNKKPSTVRATPRPQLVGTLTSSLQREKLDALPNLRILSSAIKLTSKEPGACGGKADVVQASLFRGGYSSEGELVAVKQLRNVNTEKTHKVRAPMYTFFSPVLI